MSNTGSQRQGLFPKPDASQYHRNPAYNNSMSRAAYGQVYGMQQNNAANMAALTHGLQGMNVQDSNYGSHVKNNLMATAASHYTSGPFGTGMPGTMWGANSQFVSYPVNTQQASPGMYTPMANHFMTHGYTQQHENSPMSQGWTPTNTTGEVPTLITPRRDSISSNENDAPGTPSYAGYPNFQQGSVVINRSPSGIYTHSTPSPTQMLGPYGMAMTKIQEPSTLAPQLQMLLSKEPVIPRAIPAPSSPLKPLDRALENHRGETNVYIRGLLPETTDEMLANWGSRFGDIKSSKSIIDHVTGLCKGFGFVKYHNYEDAEDCIRAFHSLGYEVSFARESFYSKLKAFSDEGNTNLYVSNLPKSMNEHELGTLFGPHKVCSAKVLRDKNGVGRGVGFARFESRDVCEEVIKTFNNTPMMVNGEEHTIQIRYADTEEQKHLKQQTAAARQFRSAEYEYATQAHKAGWLSGGRAGSYSAASGQENVEPGSEFDAFLGTSAGVPIQSQRWAQSALRQVPARSPLGNLQYGNNVQQHTMTASPTENQQSGDVKSAATTATPKVAHGDNNPTDSSTAPQQE